LTLPLIADVTVAAPSTSTAPVATSNEMPPNAVYAELLGNGLDYSINYERFLGDWPIGFRGGASFLSVPISQASGSGNLKLASFPFVASYYFGSTRHKLQLGLGTTLLYSVASSDSTGVQYGGTGLAVGATAVIGYRYVPRCHGFTFGAGFTPLLRSSKGFLPWGGVTAGYAF
jgi:hypothetical protein